LQLSQTNFDPEARLVYGAIIDEDATCTLASLSEVRKVSEGTENNNKISIFAMYSPWGSVWWKIAVALRAADVRMMNLLAFSSLSR
jgi:hypothetical protein